MFDDLDDPAFAGPSPGTRERVETRAARIRRNRQAGWAIGLATTVAFASAVAVGLGSRTRGAGPVQPVATVTATPAESPTPSPTSSPSPSTVHAGAPVVRGTPRTLPTPTKAPAPTSGCAPASGLPEPGTAPDPALTLTVDLPDEVDAGQFHRAVVTIANTSADVVADLHVVAAGRGDGLQTVADGGAGLVSGYRWTSTARELRTDHVQVRLRPGESWTGSAAVVTQECLPSDDPGGVRWRDLPPGTYRMALGIDYWGQVWTEPTPAPAPESPSASPSATAPPEGATPVEGTWGTAPREVRIV